MAQYTAFISYSHRDRAFADWLHRRLEAYRVPAKLVGSPGRDGPVPARLYPVFRDREELPTSDDLGTQILGALERSATLIVICSPDARESRWVNEEISSYRRLGRGGRILAIVARGEPNAATRPGADPAAECFPPALVHIPATADAPAQQVEPIAADARPEGDGREHALLKIIAGILGIGFEALRQRELEASRRRTRIAQGIAAAMVVLAVAATGAGWLAWQARGVAEARRVEAEQATKEEQRAREAAQRSLGAARGVLLDMTSTLGNARHFGNLGNTALQEDLAGVLAPRFNEVLDLAPDPLVAGSELDARWLLGRLLLRFGDMERAKPILEQGFNDALARVVGGTPTAQDELRLGRAGALFAEVLRRTGDWNQSAEVLARTTAVLPLPPFQTDLSAMSVERLDALSWLAGEASWHEPWNATTRFRRDSRARHAWLAEALLQRQPDDLEALMQVAFAEQQLAWSFRATAELEDAISAAGRATALARTAFQRAPINITAIRILVDARYVLAVARHEAQRAAWQEGFIRVFDADDPMSLTDANIALLARILLTEPRLGDLARQAVDIAGYAVMLRTERGEHTAALSNALGGGYSLLRFAASRESAVLLNDQMQYLAERLAYTLNRMRAEPFSDNFSKSP